MSEVPYVYAPLPAEVFDAPLPVDAYRQAPSVEAELAALDHLQVTTEWRDNREYRLRLAALQDRIALADPLNEWAQHDAHNSAWVLREFDDVHGTSRGKHGPFTPEWEAAGGTRPYARQEYVAWLAAAPSDSVAP